MGKDQGAARSRQGWQERERERESVCELRIMFSFSIQYVRLQQQQQSPRERLLLLSWPDAESKILRVISHIEFMRSSQSNMLDNMLGLSVKDSCCAVVFPCGVC